MTPLIPTLATRPLIRRLPGESTCCGVKHSMGAIKAEFLTIIWVLLAYLLVTTAVVPVIGRLADMFGRKNLYNAGFAIFTLTDAFRHGRIGLGLG